MKLNISYLGGIEEIEKGYSLTGSSTLFELIDKNEKKIYRLLVDAGAFQGSGNEEEKNKQQDIENIENLDSIIVTHAHLDHIGRIPYLVKKGFSGNIYMSKITFELAKLNWFDSVKISEKDDKLGTHFRKKLREYKKALELDKKIRNRHIKKQIREKIKSQLNQILNKYKIDIDGIKQEIQKYQINNNQDIENIKKQELLYNEEDIYKTINQVIVINEGENIKLDNFIDLKFYNAAHIEGSVLPYLTFKNENGKNYRCLIAQDLGRFKNNPMESQIKTPNKVDYIQLENTYAGRFHPDLEKSINDFINEIETHNGPILIPAFAIQRTQFVLKIILENLEKYKTKKIYITSSLAEQVKDVFLSNKYEKYNYLLNKKISFLEPKSILNKESLEKAIIIGSSGMLQGGSIEKWVKELTPKQNAKIIFTGYQGIGTRGREILDGKNHIVIDSNAIPVRCKTSYIQGFSSHADTNDLKLFLSKFKKHNGEKIRLALTHAGNNRYYFEKVIRRSKSLRKHYITKVVKLKETLNINF